MNGKLCLSDDSHGPAYVGLNYTRLKEYMIKQGVKELWYLSTPSTMDRTVGDDRGKWASTLAVRKMDGDWTSHPFWDEVGR
jgi:histidinol-phosphatase (PHP family)